MDLLLGPDGDLVLKNGDLQLARGLVAIGQRAKIALKHVLGEWFLDRDEGHLKLDRHFGKADPEEVRSDIRRTLLAVPGIEQVTSVAYQLDAETRAYSAQAYCLAGGSQELLVEVP